MRESAPSAPLRIDFVSDVACPWCAVGLSSLETAVQRVAPEIAVEMHFQPFELNPQMAAAGEDASDYLKAKYGMDDAQLQAARVRIREAGTAAGFNFSAQRERVWNTFDAHRLIHWAGLEAEGGSPAKQHALKKALLTAYHGRNENPAAREVLLAAATQSGLNADAARAVIESDRYTEDVREAEAFWQHRGIHSVPAIVINRQHLISGGQPSAVFESVLRQIAGA